MATHVLWPPEGDTGDARDLLQTKGEKSLPRLTLRTRLDLVERGLRGGVLLVTVVVVVVVVVIMIVVVVRVVRVNFLDGGRHLGGYRGLLSALVGNIQRGGGIVVRFNRCSTSFFKLRFAHTREHRLLQVRTPLLSDAPKKLSSSKGTH